MLQVYVFLSMEILTRRMIHTFFAHRSGLVVQVFSCDTIADFCRYRYCFDVKVQC